MLAGRLGRAAALVAATLTTLVGAGSCLYVMVGLPTQAWVRFGYWLVVGLIIYFAYGYRRSTLRRKAQPNA